MARLSTIRGDRKTIAGHRLLRYTAQIVNVGPGPFAILGRRPDTATKMAVVQRVHDDAGGHEDIAVPGVRMYWAGDGHNHWHLRDLEGGVLTRLDNGVLVSTAKHGFHFSDTDVFDLSLPGAPQSAQYAGCGGHSCYKGALRVKMGLSVGWMDTYSSETVHQWIDITGLKRGKYRLGVTADPAHMFSETDNTNNAASATIRITNSAVTVLSYEGGA
jgi:hypothetical protein